ncbi:hypothetical protein CPB86DRAFT_796355 [Serendipita vermifera]|nr:hypothetical protein CPB86DRAFT_796355 [Serendipita vermifera]
MAQDFRRTTTLIFLPPLLALGYITVCSAFGFAGVQWWIENVEMSPGDPTPWGWEQEMEDWSGGAKGGTDPSLGLLPRLALRSAWIFQHWAGSVDQGTRPISSYVPFALFGGADRGYELAEQQISWAIKLLREANKPIPPSVLLRHAEILEKLGSPQALATARKECVLLYRQVPRRSFEAGQLALKIGNLSAREDYDDGALEYWMRALNFRYGSSKYSPLEQRHIASVYLQLSSFYSTNEELKVADDLQRRALSTIDSFITRTSETAPSPEERLHLLYLSHRASVFGIHQAEVRFAEERDIHACINRLDSSISSSEAISRTLCAKELGPSLLDDSTRSSKVLHPDAKISKVFADAKALKDPASSLLRDTRRTCMQGYLLKGLLLEATDLDGAIDSFHKALAWAGVTTAKGKELGIPEDEAPPHVDVVATPGVNHHPHGGKAIPIINFCGKMTDKPESEEEMSPIVDSMDVTEETPRSQQDLATTAETLTGQEADTTAPMVEEEQPNEGSPVVEEQVGGTERACSEPPADRQHEDDSIIVDEPMTVDSTIQETNNANAEEELPVDDSSKDQQVDSGWGESTNNKKDGDPGTGKVGIGGKTTDSAAENADQDGWGSSGADPKKNSTRNLGWGSQSNSGDGGSGDKSLIISEWGGKGTSNERDSGSKPTDNSNSLTGWGQNQGRSKDHSGDTEWGGHKRKSTAFANETPETGGHPWDSWGGQNNKDKQNGGFEQTTEYTPMDRGGASNRRFGGVGRGYDEYRNRSNRGGPRERYTDLLPSLGKSSPVKNRNRFGYDSTDSSYHRSQDNGWPQNLDYSSPADNASPSKQVTSTVPSSFSVDTQKLKLSSQVRLGDIEGEFKEHFEKLLQNYYSKIKAIRFQLQAQATYIRHRDALKQRIKAEPDQSKREALEAELDSWKMEKMRESDGLNFTEKVIDDSFKRDLHTFLKAIIDLLNEKNQSNMAELVASLTVGADISTMLERAVHTAGPQLLRYLDPEQRIKSLERKLTTASMTIQRQQQDISNLTSRLERLEREARSAKTKDQDEETVLDVTEPTPLEPTQASAAEESGFLTRFLSIGW